jgi:hypothetical protein
MQTPCLFLLSLLAVFASPTHGASSATTTPPPLSKHGACVHNVSGVGVLDFSTVNNTVFHIAEGSKLCGGVGMNTYDFYLTLCGNMSIGKPDLQPICFGSVGCQSWGTGAGSSASLGAMARMKVERAAGRHKKESSVTATGGTDYDNLQLVLRCPTKRHRAQPRPCYFGEVVADNRYIFEWVTPLGCPIE